MSRRVLTTVALAGLWLGTTGGRLSGEQLSVLEAEEARQQQLERRVADAVKDQFPELARPTLNPAAARSVLERVLSAIRQASADRRAALLLAAHFLAVRLEPTDVPSAEEVSGSADTDIERSDLIAGYRVRYVWSPLAARWVSDRAFLRGVWSNYADTTWGEAAFVELLARGWYEHPFCGEGADEFREVIREGEAFLARSPRSRVRRDIVTMLAWAYETWWSLSRAATSDPYVPDPQAYAAGADAARARAIGYYEEALRLGLAGAVADDARGRLGKLRRRADTDQRIFHCVYD